MNKDLLAATSVFAEMVNNNVDYKDVIDDFIISVFKLEDNYFLNSKEVTNLLTDKYDFDIPEAVVKSHLKRLKKKNILNNRTGKFSLLSLKTHQEQVKLANSLEIKTSNQSKILKKLIKFVELQQGKFNDSEEKKLEEYFINYLFDKNFNGKYSELVSRFIVLNSDTDNFTEV